VEPGSDLVRGLVERATIVSTSLVAYPEARAAFARRRRERSLRQTDYSRIKRDFEIDWASYVAIQPTTALCREAGELAERFRLRGFDAIHLASFAHALRGASGTSTRFSSVDERLTRAAGALQRSRRRTEGS
jgi:uncharacterized protein